MCLAMPSRTQALTHLLRGHIPKVVHGLRCSFLINKHIFPVHYREGIEHRAQGLDSCRSTVSKKISFPRSPTPICRLTPITYPERLPCWVPSSDVNGLGSRFPTQRHRRNGLGQTAW